MKQVKESKNKYKKRSVSLDEEVIKSLDVIATKQNTNTAELIRKYVNQGLGIDKAKDDIDFIRTQIREELEIVLEKRLSWINAMYYKIAIHVIPLSHFTAQIINKNMKLSDSEFMEFQDFWERSKQEARNFISNKSTVNKKVEDVHAENEKIYGKR